MTTSRYYIKQLTSAELGEAKTHEKYIRLTNDFPYEEFFQTEGYQNNSVTQIDFTAYDKDNANEAISLKFIYYSNSNKEKRIPSIGNIFDARGVKVNDVVVLESVTTNGETKIYISFKSQGCITLNPSTIYYTIVEDKQSRELVNATDNLPLQQIFYGAPGTGKSHEVKIITGELDGLGKECQCKNVFRTTFHPDTDYATFVGCYKPTMKTVEEKYRAVAGKEEDIVYEFVPQAFTDAYIYAYKNPAENTFLVIEEINRGNCAQIFGDLFQLLDRNGEGISEYTIKADKDLAKYLTKELGADSDGIKEGKLRLPANLHILATMNTSDQSLFPMDSAFKRRWDWRYVAISYSEPKSSTFKINVGEGYSWVDFIEQVNKRIFDLTQSEDKEMGNFFIKDSIDAEQFKSKVMFYLWFEVLRDEVENSKYFFYYTTQDESGKETNHKFTFKDLYGEKAETILEGFLKYITKGAE